MILALVLQNAIDPALALLPPKMDSTAARVLLLAAGQQESRFIYRAQVGGPAHGFWQCERGGACTGVLESHATKDLVEALCESRGIAATPAAIYAAIVNDDVLAAAVARLILWADPKPLPAADDSAGGWACYLRNWRPGKPKPDTWPAFHTAARNALGVTL